MTPYDTLARFGYGPRLGEPLPTDSMAWILNQVWVPEPAPAGKSTRDVLMDHKKDKLNLAGFDGMIAVNISADREGWAKHRLATRQGYIARLVDFWMHHFSVGGGGHVITMKGAFEREAVWPNVLGRLDDMLRAGLTHPAMLMFLDNDSNIGPTSQTALAWATSNPTKPPKGRNENLARETLELYTVSPGPADAPHYTHADITAVADILSGHTVALTVEPFGYEFHAADHEPGVKLVMGETYMPGPDALPALIDVLAHDHRTLWHIARKMAQYFHDDSAPPSLVSSLYAALSSAGNNLECAAIVLYTAAAGMALTPPVSKYKSPQDLVLSFARACGANPEHRQTVARVVSALGQLGQPLWAFGQPNGWPVTADEWASTEGTARRLDWVYTWAKWYPTLDPRAVAQVALGPHAPPELLAAFDGDAGPEEVASLREALTLIACSAEFMHR